MDCTTKCVLQAGYGHYLRHQREQILVEHHHDHGVRPICYRAWASKLDRSCTERALFVSFCSEKRLTIFREAEAQRPLMCGADGNIDSHSSCLEALVGLFHPKRDLTDARSPRVHAPVPTGGVPYIGGTCAGIPGYVHVVTSCCTSVPLLITHIHFRPCQQVAHAYLQAEKAKRQPTAPALAEELLLLSPLAA